MRKPVTDLIVISVTMSVEIDCREKLILKFCDFNTLFNLSFLIGDHLSYLCVNFCSRYDNRNQPNMMRICC